MKRKYLNNISKSRRLIAKSARLINEQKATVIVEHLAYDTLSETYDLGNFYSGKTKQDLSLAGALLKIIFTITSLQTLKMNENLLKS